MNPDFYWLFWTGSPDGKIYPLDRFPVLVGVVFHLSLCGGIGYWVNSFLLRLRTTPLESTLLAMATGLGSLSAYTVLLGWMHLYSLKYLLLVPPFVFSCLGFYRLARKGALGRVPRGGGQLSEDPLQARQHWTNWIALGNLPFAILILLASSNPPWEFDVREYHLQVPKEWYQTGGITWLRHNIYGNMPLGTEMHALFAMLYVPGKDDWWWGALIGKTVSGTFSILSAASIYCLGARLFGRFAGSTASVVYLSTPWVTANSIVGYNEAAVGFFLLMSLLTLVLIFWECRNSATSFSFCFQSVRPFLMTGFFAGASVACKYTAVPFVALPVLGFTLLMVLLGNRARTAVILTFLLIGMALGGGVWFSKNLFLTGNPTYPLLESVFDSERTDAQEEQWAKAHGTPENVAAVSALQEKAGSLLVSYKWLSPLVFPFFLLGLFSNSRRLVWSLCLYLLSVFLVWLMATHRLERFLLPVLPVVCLVCGAGCCWLQHRHWKLIVFFVLLPGVGFNWMLSSSRLVGDVRIFSRLADLDCRSLNASDFYHPQGLVVPLNHRVPEIAWLNQERPQAKVLFFGECRPFEAEFDVIYNTCFDPCETSRRLTGKTPEKIRQSLKEEGITHL
ncbi:MAG: hypothetical protein VX768_21470, partial [Planctomycetota bacterium]|nr:hypothetical protein [Planctomycetota bacterium]